MNRRKNERLNFKFANGRNQAAKWESFPLLLLRKYAPQRLVKFNASTDRCRYNSDKHRKDNETPSVKLASSTHESMHVKPTPLF